MSASASNCSIHNERVRGQLSMRPLGVQRQRRRRRTEPKTSECYFFSYMVVKWCVLILVYNCTYMSTRNRRRRRPVHILINLLHILTQQRKQFLREQISMRCGAAAPVELIRRDDDTVGKFTHYGCKDNLCM